MSTAFCYNGGEHLTIEKDAGAYAHQLPAAMGHPKRARHEERDLRLAAGLTSNMIANMGKGEHISMKRLLRICGALHCDIADVIALEQDDNSVAP